MTVASFFCRDLEQVASHPCDAFAIRPFCPADADRVADLVTAVNAGAGPGGPAPRPAGLIGELQSRPGRSVSCWLARPRTAPAEAAPRGLVTLVHVHDRSGRVRWSIGWLLVHPAARRKGLGRALVAIAVQQAREAGADALWAETSAAWTAAAFWRAIGFVTARPDG